jgi:hypothetical protein
MANALRVGDHLLERMHAGVPATDRLQSQFAIPAESTRVVPA